MACCAGLAIAANSVDAAQITLRAVRKNDVPITPATTVSAAPGDVITADILMCGWNVDEASSRVKTYQATIDVRTGSSSGQTGRILPNGWNAPIDNVNCANNAGCTDPNYPVCGEFFTCVGTNHNLQDPGTPPPSPPASDGSFIDGTRPNFMFAGFTPIIAARYSEINLAFGATDIGGTGPTDPACANPKYGGTISFKVSADACGSFVFPFRLVNESFLELVQGPSDTESNFVTPTATVLTINVPNANPVCQCPGLLSSSPGNCVVDARYPHTPASQQERYDSRVVRLTFAANPPPNTAGMTASDFTITTAPAGVGTPVIESVTAVNATQVDITFTQNMPQRRWTCISYNVCSPEDNKVCVGVLPGDVNSSGRTDSGDLTELITELNRPVRVLTPFSSDLNRTNLLTASDVVAWVDLANGGGAFTQWLNQTITSNTLCPTAP